MPYSESQLVDRRSFLKKSAIGSIALGLVGCRGLPRRSASGPALHMALLSDTHVPADRNEAYRGFKPWENLERVVPEILAARPDAAVICGDAARLEGKVEDYEELHALLEPLAGSVPVHVGLGNHDDRANFLSVFKKPPGTLAPVKDKHITLIEHAAVRLIVLDSLLYPNKTPGYLGRNQRNWLASYLPTVPDRPVVLFVHHTLGDGDGDLLDADRLFALSRSHRHVRAIFYGHSHQWSIQRQHDLALVNLPALGYNFKDADPVGWVEAHFHGDGVNLRLHRLPGTKQPAEQTWFVAW